MHIDGSTDEKRFCDGAGLARCRADLLAAEGEKQSRHARELERLLTDCEDRNTQSLQPRIEHARRVQERLAQKAELFLQICACHALEGRVSPLSPC